MFEYVSIVGIASSVVLSLMVVAMLYLVWIGFGNDAHTPSPDESDQPELGEGEEQTDPQGELADGNSA